MILEIHNNGDDLKLKCSPKSYNQIEEEEKDFTD